MNYKNKYLKYKFKYIDLKNKIGGTVTINDVDTNKGLINNIINFNNCNDAINYITANIAEINNVDFALLPKPLINVDENEINLLINNTISDRIENERQKMEFLKYYNKCKLLHLAEKYLTKTRLRLIEIHEIYNIRILNEILLVSIISNKQNISNDQNYLINLGANLNKIDSNHFSNKLLTSVIIPNSVTSIGNYAFSNNDLTTLTIPNSVTSIGNLAFSDNHDLTTLTIPNSVTSIGNLAFSGNYELSNVTMPQQFHSNSEKRRIFGSMYTDFIVFNNV
jgi:hypothetical protein